MRMFPIWLILCVSIVRADGPPVGFSSTGDWRYSGFPGHAPDRGSLMSNSAGATATWNPAIRSVAPVRIWFYLVAHSLNDPKALIEVIHRGVQGSIPIDMTAGESRWVNLGKFNFAGTGEEHVRLVQKTPGTSVRAAAVKFEILDHDSTILWQTLIMDNLVPFDQDLLRSHFVEFEDMQNHWAALAAGVMAGLELLPGTDFRTFEPEREISRHHFAAALRRQSGVLTPIRAEEAMQMLVDSARQSGRNFEWMKKPEGTSNLASAKALGLVRGDADKAYTAGRNLTRGQAAVLLQRYYDVVAESGPPVGSQWQLAFSDDFAGSGLDAEKWEAARGEVRAQSMRVPENVAVQDGLLKLVTRKEKRGETEWTAGFVWSRAFRQKYGYWEARFRYAGSTGLNQAFFINPAPGVYGKGFEIDVNEGHYPSEVNVTVHQSDVDPVSSRYLAPFDLSKDFHTYGVEWNEQELIYYFDGKEISRKANATAHEAAAAGLGTAVIRWAGAVTDELNGKSMDVEWVRVWRRK